ncbi:MAG: DbpA RNA binding domain-containing protein, partial [Rudanella sp.]|nr:DbpA RNA binding domain-containing protein [Rudanella sp.]
EFDKSLELGFHDEMGFIVRQLTGLRKQVLVSATHGIKIPDFVRLRNPQTVIHQADEETLAALAMKVVYSPEKDKVETLFNLLCTLDSEPALIFLNHREAAERTRDELAQRGIQAGVYHGGMEQPDRERALIQFRNGSVRYLITTDLAARGLDIPEMNYVIHYHLPLKEHEFVHRNGRTARMRASGTAYVILSRDETRPDYLPGRGAANSLEEFLIPAQTRLPNPPEFVTVYVSGGRKNKLNKVDIVGFFGQKGQLEKGDLGRIDVQDFISFAAVKREKVTNLLALIREEKMKGKKYKIEVAR